MAFYDVVGHKGARNVEIINVTPSGDLTEVVVDNNGFFDFTANDVTKVEVTVDDQTLSNESAGNSIVYSGVDLEVEFGDFDLATGIYIDVEVSVYIGTSTERIVIASQISGTKIRLTYKD